MNNDTKREEQRMSHKRFSAGRTRVKKLFGQYEKFCLQRARCLPSSFSAYLKSRSSSMSSCRGHWGKEDFDKWYQTQNLSGASAKRHSDLPVLMIFLSSKKGEMRLSLASCLTWNMLRPHWLEATTLGSENIRRTPDIAISTGCPSIWKAVRCVKHCR